MEGLQAERQVKVDISRNVAWNRDISLLRGVGRRPRFNAWSNISSNPEARKLKLPLSATLPSSPTEASLSKTRKLATRAVKVRDILIDWRRKPEYMTMSQTHVSTFRARAAAVLSQQIKNISQNARIEERTMT